jgi:hypothetical protein
VHEECSSAKKYKNEYDTIFLNQVKKYLRTNKKMRRKK